MDDMALAQCEKPAVKNGELASTAGAERIIRGSLRPEYLEIIQSKERRPHLDKMKRPAVANSPDTTGREPVANNPFMRIIAALDKNADQRGPNAISRMLLAARGDVLRRVLEQEKVFEAVGVVIRNRLLQCDSQAAMEVAVGARHHLNMDPRLCGEAFADGLEALVIGQQIEEAVRAKKLAESYEDYLGGLDKVRESIRSGIQNRIECGHIGVASKAAYRLGLSEEELACIVEKVNMRNRRPLRVFEKEVRRC